MDAGCIIKAVIVGIGIIVSVVARYVFKKKSDSEVEKLAEKIIKEETGLNIDLSPDEKQKDK